MYLHDKSWTSRLHLISDELEDLDYKMHTYGPPPMKV